MADETAHKKPGFFSKLFSSKSRDADVKDEKRNRSPSTSPTTADVTGSLTVKPQKEKSAASGGQTRPKKKSTTTTTTTTTTIPSVKVDPPPDEKKPTTTTRRQSSAAPKTAKKPAQEKPAQEKVQKSSTAGGIQRKRLSRKKSKKGSKGGDIAPADPNQRLEFPTTPETILAIHKRRPFLNQNEEWLIVELNEYECLVENLDVIKEIAKHSKFFEVDPDELWEEFFEYVEEMPSYDEVINYDVWQEFRDEKYPC